MNTFILSPKAKNNRPAQPNAEMLKIIEETDKQPEECDKTFDFRICKIRHAKAVRDYKAAIATGSKRPKKEPCYYCQLINDKIAEEAPKTKGENAIEYEDEEPKKTSKTVLKEVTKELDYESRALVSAKKEEKTKETKKVEPAETKCAFCGKSFIPSSPKTKYCSVSCRDKQNNKKRVEIYRKLRKPPVLKKCLYCGEEFLSGISNKVFCCTKCRDRYNNKIRSSAANEFNEQKIAVKAVPEIEENQLTKEAPVNSFALKENKAKVKEPDESIYYVSPKHALSCLSDSLQRFNDVVDLITEQVGGAIGQIAIYLSDDIYTTNNRIKSYLDRLEGTSS